MLILLILISVLIIILGVWLQENSYDFESLGIVLVVIGVTVVVITSAIFLDMLSKYPCKVDEKIVMYNKENEHIENKIKEAVKTYMNYEQEIYQNLVQNESLETLVIAYPELNSNELIKFEIQTYKENSSKIKELKEKSIIKSTYDWWLYFGGK